MSAVSGEDTNIYYLPVDPKAYFGKGVGENAEAAQLKAAERSPESRPAELDPDGHWGKVISGLQVGVRFSTNKFAIDRPIVARVILRNTTTNVISILGPPSAQIDLRITDERHNVFTNPPPRMVSGPAHTTLPPRRQISYSFDLEDIMGRRPSAGVYHITAKHRVQPELDVVSGTAPIEVH